MSCSVWKSSDEQGRLSLDGADARDDPTAELHKEVYRGTRPPARDLVAGEIPWRPDSKDTDYNTSRRRLSAAVR
jgi:hypothetical protein